MDLDYLSFVGSCPVAFQIGSARKAFYIHDALVRQHFGTLWEAYGKSRLIQRDIFEDIEEDTFVRFVEFAYSGDYSVPRPVAFPAVNENEDGLRIPIEPEIVPYPDETSLDAGTEEVPLGETTEEAPEATEEAPEATEEAPEATEEAPEATEEAPEATEEVPNFHPETSWNGLGSKRAKKKRNPFTYFDQSPEPTPTEYPAIEETPATPTKRERLWNSFTRLAKPKVIPPWEPDTSPDADLDFSPIFLSHASLYVFSGRFSIPTLRQLTLNKLRLTLSRFDLLAERRDAIVQLLKYTYTKTKDSEDNPDKLRELVLDYVTCHVESLAANRAFLHLLQEPGSLCKDLMLKVLRRLD